MPNGLLSGWEKPPGFCQSVFSGKIIFAYLFRKKPASYSYQHKRSPQENWPKMFGICPSNKWLITRNINAIFSVLSGVQ